MALGLVYDGVGMGLHLWLYFAVGGLGFWCCHGLCVQVCRTLGQPLVGRRLSYGTVLIAIFWGGLGWHRPGVTLSAWAGLCWWGLGIFGYGLAVVDAYCLRLPYLGLAGLLVSSLGWQQLPLQVGLWPAGLGGVFGLLLGLSLWLGGKAWGRWRGYNANITVFGSGDVWLLACLGVLLPGQRFAWVLLLGLLLAGMLAVWLIWRAARGRVGLPADWGQLPLPLGTCWLVAACLLLVF